MCTFLENDRIKYYHNIYVFVEIFKILNLDTHVGQSVNIVYIGNYLNIAHIVHIGKKQIMNNANIACIPNTAKLSFWE